MGRLFRVAESTLGSEGVWRHSTLLYGNLAAGKTSTGYGIHDFLCRQPDLSQSATDSRCGPGSSVRPHSDRDRLPLPCSSAAAGQAKRTSIRKRDGTETGRVAWTDGGRSRPANQP